MTVWTKQTPTATTWERDDPTLKRLLQETAELLLLEDGFYILLESSRSSTWEKQVPTATTWTKQIAN